jgi:cysteinyl-tRNA synthetase
MPKKKCPPKPQRATPKPERETMLTLHNNLTRKTETFQPAQDKQVKMYTCGPSTYQRPHIGNYRTFLFEDILQRYLEYLGYKVTRLITLTNIEDKAIMSAEAANITVDELTNRNEGIFFQDFDKLCIKRPDFSVRASNIVDQAVALIQILVKNGVAYKHNHEGAENIYFDPHKFSGFGKLAHLNMQKWPKRKRLFHLDTYPGMPWNRGDFVLWHGCRRGDKVCWDTDIGRGRPAWNIQDAAMVTKHLGFSVDIACGGIDNLVRHHDYTLAVAEAASGKPFARYWLHGGHLYVDGKKMSKSKGNVLYPENLTERGYRNEQVRFLLIYADYKRKTNFTWEKLAETSRKLDQLKASVKALQHSKAKTSSPRAKTLAHSIAVTFGKHMDNDLDVKGAFDKLHRTLAQLARFAEEEKLSREDARAALTDMKEADRVLQVVF